MVGGAVAIAVVLVIVIPVAVLVAGAVGSMILGQMVKTEVDAQHEGSELLDLDG